jgi:twitching motility protein PilT
MIHDLNKIVELAVERNASDIHFTCGLPVKCRIDGKITNLTEEKLSDEDCENFAKELLNDKIERISTVGEIDIGYTFPDGTRTRGNIYRQNRHISIALRILSSRIPSIDELGLPDCVFNVPKLQNGIVLLTGETGAGKSTTLAAIIDNINHSRDAHVITLEDPIEYIFDSDRSIISQREIGVDTKDFHTGLRAILREDPDVIMVGEMRDYETIEAALTAAETGHLVLATLHTNSAADTLDRIVGVFPDASRDQIRMQLSNTLCYIITQKLLPKSNGNGRTLACEVMVVNNAMRNLIREGKTHQLETFITLTAQDGSVSMDTALQRLVQNGEISLETALVYARNKENLRRTCIYQTPATPSEKGFFKKSK